MFGGEAPKPQPTEQPKEDWLKAESQKGLERRQANQEAMRYGIKDREDREKAAYQEATKQQLVEDLEGAQAAKEEAGKEAAA